MSVHHTATGQNASYDGTVSGMSSNGQDEMMDVDVVAVANDGGLVVRAQSQVQNQPRPEQAVTCAVYGDGRVICPPNAPVSQATNLLLGLLGRGFYDPSVITADGTWKHSFDYDEFSVVSNFKRNSAADVSPVQMEEHTDVTPKHSVQGGWHSDTRISYDAAMSVPVSVHDESFSNQHGMNGDTVTIDLQLTQDSFAKHG